jgi:hypothetical protein
MEGWVPSLSFVSESQLTREEALDGAYSQYCASNIHNEVIKQFSLSFEKYSIPQFIEFILQHHL